MKKFVSVFLAVCMMCSVAAAFAEDILGDWYLNSIVVGEAAFNPADIGMRLVLHFDENGHVTQTSESFDIKEESSGTWVLTDKTLIVNMNDEAEEGVFEDGKISILSDGQTGVFSREEPVATARPTVTAANSEDEFYGDWTLAAMDMMGVYVQKDQFEQMGLFGYEADLTISEGKIDSTIKLGEGEEEHDTISDYIFDEGKLFMNLDLSEGVEDSEGSEDMNISASIEKVVDGSILYSVDFMGMPVGLYLTRAEAAE